MTAASAVVAFVDKATREGDDLFSLSSAYKEGFTKGSSVTAISEAIARANGIPWDAAKIDAWVFSHSKKRRGFVKTDNPGMFGGPANVGWAHFAAGNVIKLPDVPRAGDTVAPPVTVSASAPMNWKKPLLIAGGLFALLLIAGGGKKKRPSTVP